MLQAASVGAASTPLGPAPKVDLSALAILVQQCFVAAGVPVPNVDATILHGMAMGLGISTRPSGHGGRGRRPPLCSLPVSCPDQLWPCWQETFERWALLAFPYGSFARPRKSCAGSHFHFPRTCWGTGGGSAYAGGSSDPGWRGSHRLDPKHVGDLVACTAQSVGNFVCLAIRQLPFKVGHHNFHTLACTWQLCASCQPLVGWQPVRLLEE